MKFSLVITATFFTFFTVSLTAPVTSNYVPADDLVTRASGELDTLAAREWIALYTRTGSFAETSKERKMEAYAFVNKAKKGGQLANAASPAPYTKTYLSRNGLHLDRQQPTNNRGEHKVAVQLNEKDGRPTTIGQVVIHKDADPSIQTVAYKLKKSIKSGKEKFILPSHPSKKKQNIAKNEAARKAKQERIAAKLKANAKARLTARAG